MWFEFDRSGTRLAYKVVGGKGRTVVLLHGLAGHAEEWSRTASWLAASHEVLAPDARGHGRSARHPVDVSAETMADDVVAVLEHRRRQRAVVVGQSFGGLTALTLAARHPEIVEALVLIEAGPAKRGTDADRIVADVVAGLSSWPESYSSLDAAESFFTEQFGHARAGRVWSSGLERRADRWWLWFDPAVMGRELRAALVEERWDDWERVRCPTLVVRGEWGTFDRTVVDEMTRRRPGTTIAELKGAGHDAHLDQPDRWRDVLGAFLDRNGL